MKSTLLKARTLVLAIVASATAFLPIASAAAAAGRLYDLIYGGLVSTRQSFALGANTLTGLIPSVYQALDNISREFVGFIPSVMRDAKVAAAAKGQTVVSPITPQAVAADITPGVTAPNDGDQVLTSMNLSLTKSRYVPIRWNGEEQLGLNNAGPGADSILVAQITQAFRTLANEMETDIALAAYKAASRAYGTAGTTPFGTAGDLSDFAETAKILDINGAPPNRAMIVGANAMANLRGKQSVLFKVNEAGTDDLLRRGRVGMVEGFDIGYSAGIGLVTKGTGASYVTSGTYVIGATAITLVTGTGTVLAGDVVTFAGDTNKYVVAVGVAAPGVITLNQPGLRQALGSGVAMTIGNNYTPSVAFSKDALLLATRTPAVPIDSNGNRADMADDRTTVTDPFSGISFEVSLYRQYRQIKYEVGLVWGVGAPNPAHIATLLG